MMLPLRGTALMLGDSVNSDILHPPKYFSLDPERVKDGLFRGMASSIRESLTPDTIIIAGRNFGCGSSREVVTYSLKLNGIRLIIAVSFARICFRNCINQGILPIECDATGVTVVGDRINVDPVAGIFRNETQGRTLVFPPVDRKLLELVSTHATSVGVLQ